MAKRFTDNDKWKRPWFSDLPNIAKLAWIYILDDCDHRGVWAANFKRISFDLGQTITAEDFAKWFGQKLQTLDGDKYFIPSFLEFQYGDELSPNNNAHKSILHFLKKHGLSLGGPREPLASPSPGPNEGIMRGPWGAQDKDKEQDKDKDKGKDQEEGSVRGEALGSPKTQPITQSTVRACCDTWIGTLEHFKIPRPLSPTEQFEIARAIQKWGAEFVDLALYGARFEPRFDGFKPEEHVSLARIFEKDKAGKFRFDKFVNWGAKRRQAEKRAPAVAPQQVAEVEEPTVDPAEVRAILDAYGFGAKAVSS